MNNINKKKLFGNIFLILLFISLIFLAYYGINKANITGFITVVPPDDDQNNISTNQTNTTSPTNTSILFENNKGIFVELSMSNESSNDSRQSPSTSRSGGGSSGGGGGGGGSSNPAPVIPPVNNITNATNKTSNNDTTSDSSPINLINPRNNAGNNNNKIYFTYNLTNYSSFNKCELLINNSVYYINTKHNSNIQKIILDYLPTGKYNWKIQCTDINGNITYSKSRNLTIIPSDKFTGITTNLSLIDISSIPRFIIERPIYGKIIFSELIDLSNGIDINKYINISHNFISIDSSNLPELNISANLTLYNLEFYNPVILRNNKYCTECKIISYTPDGNLTFSVNHFSNYSASENSQLRIWDSTDDSRNVLNITFYANYTNITDNSPITTATCNIFFSDSSSSMSYNSTSQLYEYNKTLNLGLHFYNVSCSASGFTSISLSDYASIHNSYGPSGANVTFIRSERMLPIAPDNHGAYAGNVTELTIRGKTITQSWQGYFGNVSGIVQLADASSNVLYNWTSLTPSGEVYATRASDVHFATIGCADSLEITNEENFIGHSSDDADSISNTFNKKNHPEFYVGPTQIASNNCNSTNLFDSGGSQTSFFFEVLLADGASNIVYTSILEDNRQGFDSAYYDFEMIVGENGHGNNTAITTYYFFLEI